MLHDVRPGIGGMPDAIVLTEASARLEGPAGPPLFSPPAANAGLRTKWSWALAASSLFHAAVAALLLAAGSTAILIEGADDAGIAMFGNAANDELQAGEPLDSDVTQVTLVTMLPAQTVTTVDAETIAVDAAESSPATIPQSESIAAAPADVVEPVREAAAEPVAPESAAPTPASSAAPEVLTAETIDPAEDNRVAPPVETRNAETAPAAESAIVPPTAVVIPDERSPTAATPAPVPVQRMQPESATQPAAAADSAMVPPPAVVIPDESPLAAADSATQPAERTQPETLSGIEPQPTAEELRVAEAETIRAEPDAPVVEPEPEATAKPEAKPKKPSTPPAKAEPKKAEAKPARQKKAERTERTARENADGARGQGKTNARKGVADGNRDGKTAAKGKGGKSGAGNAAVSNYPGKVVAKLRRAARSISRSAVRKARNDVQVGFTVNADGGVSGIRITRSSGSPELDRAALAVVRRAAPFPPIPEGAGRSSWAFAVPLGVAR